MSAAMHISCDAAAAQSATPGSAALHPRLVLAATILASSLAYIDGSVVNVALPAIGHSLAADSAALQWIVNAYLLPLSALLLLGGAAGDRFGRRRLLMAGTSVFALASMGCALAPGLPSLLGSRFLQGVGAAMLMPNSLAILGQTFAGPAKGRAIGVWAATGAAAGAIGPVLGGWLQLWTQVVGKVRLLTAHKPARIWRERMSDHVVTTTSLAAEPNWPRSRSPAGRPWPAGGAASCIPR